MGLFGSRSPQDIRLAQYEPPKPSFFSEGGVGRGITGTIGDYLLQLNGLRPIYAPARQAQTEFEQGQQIYQRKRADEQADWQARQEWELAHPKPNAPTEYERLLAARGLQPGTPGYNAAIDAKLYPPVPVQGFDASGNPTVTFVPRGGVGQSGGGLPDRPTGALKPYGGGSTGAKRPFDAVVEQESGGRVGIQGPQTKYGRAQGLAQLLPSTAREQAGNLGIAWRPELMTATTPEGAAYQRQLGESYLNEGLRKTGNLRDALRYYHGGPNRSMWGQKTNKYAAEVLGRIGER